jgi:sulfoxide reductase heme-binding subunit YedZ
MNLHSTGIKRFSLARHPIRSLIHPLTLLPLLVLALDWWASRLGVNPIQAAEQRTGDIAIVLLGLSLACTPIQTLTGWKQIRIFRRPLGLYAFLYAAIHVILFTVVDFGLDLRLLWEEFLQKYYLWAGLPAMVILLILAVTSPRIIVKSLGKSWKLVHRLVYLCGLLVFLHLAVVIKGDLFQFTGAIWKPLLAGIVLVLLLGLRLLVIRRWINSLRLIISPGEPNVREPYPDHRG